MEDRFPNSLIMTAIRDLGRSNTSASVLCEIPFRLAIKMTRSLRNLHLLPIVASGGRRLPRGIESTVACLNGFERETMSRYLAVSE